MDITVCRIEASENSMHVVPFQQDRCVLLCMRKYLSTYTNKHNGDEILTDII